MKMLRILESVLCTAMAFLLVNRIRADAIHRKGDHCNKTVDTYEAVSSPPVTDENRGRPLHCSYRIRARPPRPDWVVFVRFTRLRVGQPSADRSRCTGGYVQIVDGYKESNISNRETAGFYCGDIDSPKTFISETPYVKIVFHVESYGPNTFLQFDASVEKQGEVHARYGQFPHLYPNRRGAPVDGSYCDRIFSECAPGRCFVQSPGFPGIYPRGLRCAMRIGVRKRALVGLDLVAFDVDGLRCDNLLACFPRPVSRDPRDCPFDVVRVYDGVADDSPLIVSLCGRGRLKSNIIASGSDIFVEFITSNAGPLLNTGFHFKADSIVDPESSEPLQLRNNSCFVERYLPENKESTFSNLRSWYPPNTTCAYRFYTTPEDVIRLDFQQFRIERFTLCEESVKLYDDAEPKPTKIITKLCDMNKAQAVYESTGPHLYVEFVSSRGSLDGSSISYEFQVKSVGASSLESGHACSRVLDRDGQISLPLHEINATNQPVTCNYTLDASSLMHGRVNLTLEVPFEKFTKSCLECKSETVVLEILGATIDETPLCLCHVSRRRSVTITSLSSIMVVTLKTQPVYGDSKPPGTSPMPNKHSATKDITGSFTLFSDERCGPEILKLDLQGSITFPSFQEFDATPGPVHCLWQVPLLPGKDAGFRLESFMGNNCSSDYLKVNHVLLCPTLAEHSFVVQREDIKSSHVLLDLRASEAMEVNFTLWWTQLRVLPTPSTSSDYSLMSLGKECEFLCAAAMACIRKELVCNGVPNCPRGKDTPLYAPDEEPAMCMAGRNNLDLHWWVIGFGLGICTCILIGLLYSVCRRCRNHRERF